MNTPFSHARCIAGCLILSLAALVACQSAPPEALPYAVPSAPAAPVTTLSTAAAAMPPPQAPFDTTPITPVESAGAAAQ